MVPCHVSIFIITMLLLMTLQSWKDPFLQWRPSDYSGLRRITVRSNTVWMPEVAILNSYVFYLRNVVNYLRTASLRPCSHCRRCVGTVPICRISGVCERAMSAIKLDLISENLIRPREGSVFRHNYLCRNKCNVNAAYRGDRGWLSHGLVVTLTISYSLDGGTLWGFTRDMRTAD